MLLVTAIANPQRLEPYLPDGLIKGRVVLPDHAWFEREQIEEEMKKAGVKRILTTEKDLVKLEGFGFETALLKLRLDLDPHIYESVERRVGHESFSK